MQLNQEQLIDLFDGSRPGKGVFEMQPWINEDPDIAAEWEYLHMAVEGVQAAAISEQVKNVRSEWTMQQSTAVRPSGAVIHTLYRNVMRVAACFLLVVVGSGLYKYASTSSSAIYRQHYALYELTTSRGAEAQQDAIEDAYREKNWANVINIFNGAKDPKNKSYFLSGMADMELKRYDDAIGKFQQVIANNVRTGGDSYQDEAEFYLAMSWLAKDEVKEAMPILKKISADKSHLYHDVVVKISSMDLRIAAYKEVN